MHLRIPSVVMVLARSRPRPPPDDPELVPLPDRLLFGRRPELQPTPESFVGATPIPVTFAGSATVPAVSTAVIPAVAHPGALVTQGGPRSELRIVEAYRKTRNNARAAAVYGRSAVRGSEYGT